MTKRHDEEPEQLPADKPRPGQLPTDEPRPELPIVEEPPRRRPKATPLEGEAPETTRVLLTGDNRSQVTERYIPTAELGFRIKVDGQWFEHIDEAADSGTWIFAPTR